MKADTFLDVFGQYMKPELTAPFDGGTVLRLWTEQERRAIGVAVALPAPVKAECIFAAERALAESLCLAHAEIVPHYPAETLNGECLPMLAAFLRRRQKAVNGTFDGASAVWDGTTFRVTLACGGRNILTATHADMMLRDLITEQFGCHALVEFIGGDEVDTAHEHVRELREELGVGVVALDELFRITHETEHAVIRLRFIRTVLPEGEAVTPLEGQSFGWFDLKEPMPPDLLAPDRPVWEFLAE